MLKILKRNARKAINTILFLKCQLRFIRVKKHVSAKKKVKVAFLVNENQKWNCTSLFNFFCSKNDFEPVIVLSKLPRDGEEEYHVNKQFFIDRNMTVIDGYDFKMETYIMPEAIDIVFYQQPYGFFGCQDIDNVSKNSLTCYIPYSVLVANDSKAHYGMRFQRLLWRYFAPNNIIERLYWKTNPFERIFNKEKVQSLGHPKLDYFIKATKVDSNRKTIIYAPHHSLDPWSDLKYATFEWNGLEILELAKQDTSINWIFKPHPRLMHALVENKIMNQKEVKDYFDSWNEMPHSIVNNSGDYFEDFQNSDLLITDCGSFLAEYLPTKKPVIVLCNPESAGYNEFGNVLVENYYKVGNKDQLLTLFNQIVYLEQDPMKYQRDVVLNKLFNFDKSSGKSIGEYVVDLIKN